MGFIDKLLSWSDHFACSRLNCLYSLLLFPQAQDWLYTDGEDASASEFKERLDSLKAIGDPIFFRLNR